MATTTVPNQPCCTWKPTTAGILTIIAGAIEFIAGMMVIALGNLANIWYNSGFYNGAMSRTSVRFVEVIGLFFVVLGIVAVIGGILALKRYAWGMALAGAITSLFTPPGVVLGILSIIFVSLGKGEFNQAQQIPPPPPPSATGTPGQNT